MIAEFVAPIQMPIAAVGMRNCGTNAGAVPLRIGRDQGAAARHASGTSVAGLAPATSRKRLEPNNPAMECPARGSLSVIFLDVPRHRAVIIGGLMQEPGDDRVRGADLNDCHCA